MMMRVVAAGGIMKSRRSLKTSGWSVPSTPVLTAACSSLLHPYCHVFSTLGFFVFIFQVEAERRVSTDIEHGQVDVRGRVVNFRLAGIRAEDGVNHACSEREKQSAKAGGMVHKVVTPFEELIVHVVSRGKRLRADMIGGNRASVSWKRQNKEESKISCKANETKRDTDENRPAPCGGTRRNSWIHLQACI
jgi:hypothetical protein